MHPNEMLSCCGKRAGGLKEANPAGKEAVTH
jgi:hypothetical protein